MAHEHEARQVMHRFPVGDPFFETASTVTEAEKLILERRRREAFRAAMNWSVVPSKVNLYVFVVMYCVWIIGVPLSVAVRSLLPPRGPRYQDFFIGLALAIIAAAIPTLLWLRQVPITRAMASLCAALGGTHGKNRFLPVVDWLDAHWQAETPREIIDPSGPFEHRWDLQTRYDTHPILVLVHRRSASFGTQPEVMRTSFYLSAPNTSPPTGYELTSAMRKLDAMGCWVKRTPAGVFVTQAGVSPSKLDPDRVMQVLEAARSLARASP